MNRNEELFTVADILCIVVAGIFVLGMLFLVVRLKSLQVDSSANYNYANVRQSERRVQTEGLRGRILDRNGNILAGNRTSLSIVCDVARFRRRNWTMTVDEIVQAVENVAKVTRLPMSVTRRKIERHVRQELARPLECWKDVPRVALARFFEHSDELPGFSCKEHSERIYPYGSSACHLIGYVSHARGDVVVGDEKFNFFEPEMDGRAGVENYYNEFLRGVPGERRIRVDALGYAISEWTITESAPGPDLKLTLDMKIQRSAEEVMKGLKGAFVALDPRTGDILASVSMPGYDLNAFIPFISEEEYAKLRNDPDRPFLDRAMSGLYAPGSTFKPIVALAALASGVSCQFQYNCTGVYEAGGMRLRCASRWGHGELAMTEAIMRSCNPYFCALGVKIGTNEICRASRAFGLGSKTGVDFVSDSAGVVPDADWKMSRYGERWYFGDLVQMSIGQGMLLATPLQMARVAGAIGTGMLVTPRLKIDIPVEKKALPYSREHLEIVREGMRMVVTGNGISRGTGFRAGKGVPVSVSGKTGTAEIGRGATRRKNAWFIAYAPSEKPEIAIAVVIENAEGGGVDAAPRVAVVLKEFFAARNQRAE
ncbi:MAG: penicillin-binding protein 2 [Kiritimatiellae bacterium]|nr:penicillin-binding protein 2 [Kiritimatiellia bacterium]